jgi:S-adenosylmethionine hydrolase
MAVFYPIMTRKPNRQTPVFTSFPQIVTLTSDFGLKDAYAASMKAAILKEAPRALLIDITHEIPRQDILCGSIMLERALDGFPPGTVHLVVVDPGVGTERRVLVVEIHRQKVVCPDNGLITWAWRRLGHGQAHELIWRPSKFSATFHGRDILGPAAGMLAAGKAITKIARKIDNPILLDVMPARSPARRGNIIHIDHFGNATTNIPRETMGKAKMIRIGKKRLGAPKRTYCDTAPGRALALFGSAGLLEIAVRDGSAQKSLSLRIGDEIILD